MNWLLLCRLLGQLAMLVGGSMVVSLPWAFPALGEADRFETGGFWGLVAAVAASFAVGGSLYFVGRRESDSSILRKEALAVVGLGWLLAGVLGALPFLLSGTEREAGVPMGVADALFESISGFTTTGASVLTELEEPGVVPRCILFWRSFTHWLGGMGIIVLFVAILRQLGAGGKALLRREVPGPMSSTVRPRVRDAAMVMWKIYVVITLVLTVLLKFEGMSVFDSLCHSFGTMATGGFSTRNQSVGGYANAGYEWTIIVFMVLAGTNFSLYYTALTARDQKGNGGWRNRLQVFWSSPEFRAYLGLLLVAGLLLTCSLYSNRPADESADGLPTTVRKATFQAVAIMTTTGFSTVDFDRWSDFSRGLLILLMFIGGCAGSTGGGLKVVRFILFAKIVWLEIEKAYRPNVVRPLRLAGRPIDRAQRHQVVVYFALVLLIFVTSWMLLLVIEPSKQWQVAEHKSDRLVDTAGAVAATLNNIGPGLGVVGPTRNYAAFAPQSKLLLALLMLLGRLELFAILVLFVPSFWRRR